MSDLMFLLESRLSTEQRKALAAVEAAARKSDLNLFLSGGTVRDLLGHLPIVDLDFAVEGNPGKMVKDLVKDGAKVETEDTHRKLWELVFAGGVTVEVGMSRLEKYAKPGAKAQVTPAQIEEDLPRRDFSINAMALSLNDGSRGLLRDPTNGKSDLETRELRTANRYAFYDDPSRVLRLLRFQARFGFTVEERTQQQVANVREAGLCAKLPEAALHQEIRSMAAEPNVIELLKLLEAEKLLDLFSPALAGAKGNTAGLTRLWKARQMVPFGLLTTDNLAIFLHVLTEKMNPKEKAQLAKNCGLSRGEVERWNKLPTKAKALEKALKSPKLTKPSAVYAAIAPVPGEQVLYLLTYSQQRLVLDRLKNYLQKYAQTAAEVTDAEVTAETGVQPGTPKFAKAREGVLTKRLNARPKKIAPVEEAPPPPNPVGRPRKVV